MSRDHTPPIRIGAVNYLNSKPLIEDLQERLSGLSTATELRLDYPSRLADDLESGELDIALIPLVECLRNPDYEVVTDACVATHGPVLSVKLYSRVAISEITSLALDEGSRTSATLARILLHERYGVQPQLEPLPLGGTIEQTSTDAILLIGDRAMHPPAQSFEETWDLGEEWSTWTGLPFVFALWATRQGDSLDGVAEALMDARDQGLARLEEIGRREAVGLGIPVEAAIEYLTENLYYRLGSAERHGIALFQRLAVEQGLVPEGVDLVLRDCTVTR